MSLTDYDVLCRFRDAVGVGCIGPSKRRADHHKPAWQWWSNESEFHSVYAALKPWLSLRRIAAAEEAIQARAAHIQTATAERECVCCGEQFSPQAFTKGSWKQNRCAKPACQLFRQSALRKEDVARHALQT
jgi:hypothetical protein